jgi:predicted DNA-binding transcriptional regulator AlpA
MTHDAKSLDRDGMTRAELLTLPAVVDVATAARALGLGRSTAYELARRDEFPCRVLHIGSSYRVPTADLLRVLGIEPPVWEQQRRRRSRESRS